MSTGIYLVDNPPRIRQFRSPRRAKETGCIVVHTAENFADENPPDRGAENVANFIRNRTNYGSYHDLADSDSIVRMVRYSDEAFHDATGSNPWSYGVSAAVQAAKWNDYDSAYVSAVVRNMALASARYAKDFERRTGLFIPARLLTKEQSDAGWRGFISHALRDPNRRTDPGKDFPWKMFFGFYMDYMSGVQQMEPKDVANYRRAFGSYVKRHFPETVKKYPKGYSLFYLAEMGYAYGRRAVNILTSTAFRQSIAYHVHNRTNPSNGVLYGTMARHDYRRIAEIHDMLSELLKRQGVDAKLFTVAAEQDLSDPDPMLPTTEGPEDGDDEDTGRADEN